MNKKNYANKLTQLALFASIIIILALTPLGFIPINPLLRPTTVHIPVILGGIILGPLSGGILGAVFGVASLCINTFQPTAASFVFSPAASGNFLSLVICFVPRILIGVFAGYTFKFISKFDKNKYFATSIAGIIGSMTNTILVMSGIYLFFGERYAAVKGKTMEALFGFIMTVVATNGVPEAIVASVIVVAIAKPLLKLQNKL